MDPFSALHHRVSTPVLQDPGPTPEQLQAIYLAALRAPDHRQLRPWQYIVVQGEDLIHLGELFAKAVKMTDSQISEPALERCRGLPLRAPLVIIATSVIKEDCNVPMIEQVLSTGAAVQSMQLAVQTMGLGSIWRTGDMAYHPIVKQGLGLSEKDHIVGYLYIGTPAGKIKSIPQLNIDEFFKPLKIYSSL